MSLEELFQHFFSEVNFEDVWEADLQRDLAMDALTTVQLYTSDFKLLRIEDYVAPYRFTSRNTHSRLCQILEASGCYKEFDLAPDGLGGIFGVNMSEEMLPVKSLEYTSRDCLILDYIDDNLSCKLRIDNASTVTKNWRVGLFMTKVLEGIDE